jgi:hypothetical protein
MIRRTPRNNAHGTLWALGLKIFYIIFELGVIGKHGRKDVGRH